MIAAEQRAKQEKEELLQSSLNNRVSGTEDEAAKLAGATTDSLERAKDSSKEEAKKLMLPKRNLFVQFKAFPNLE